MRLLFDDTLPVYSEPRIGRCVQIVAVVPSEAFSEGLRLRWFMGHTVATFIDVRGAYDVAERLCSVVAPVGTIRFDVRNVDSFEPLI
jgi:hypothetical protein